MISCVRNCFLHRVHRHANKSVIIAWQAEAKGRGKLGCLSYDYDFRPPRLTCGIQSTTFAVARREQHMVSPCLRASLLTLQQREPPKSFAQQQADKAAAEAALEAANAKLEELNKVEKLAPKSWADLGVPRARARKPAVWST